MKKTLLVCAALCALASNAFAVGCDLTARACPGGAGATQDWGTLDCAGGETVQLYGTFQVAEAIPDLVGIDAILDLTVDGNVLDAANFWDLGTPGTNPGALGGSHQRPATLCDAYEPTWDLGNSNFATLAAVQRPDRTRIALMSYSPGEGIAVIPEQKLFGFSLTIDAATALEANATGTASGCAVGASIQLVQLFPGSLAGLPVTLLTGPNRPNGNVVTINGGALPSLPTSTTHQSWGQLKSLYR